MNSWHLKVEARVTQTLKFFNTSRLLKIIGYDPVQHIKFENINWSKEKSILNSAKNQNSPLKQSIKLEDIQIRDRQVA